MRRSRKSPKRRTPKGKSRRSRRYGMKPAHKLPVKTQKRLDMERELEQGFSQVSVQELRARKKAIQQELKRLEEKKQKLNEELVFIDFELLSF